MRCLSVVLLITVGCAQAGSSDDDGDDDDDIAMADAARIDAPVAPQYDATPPGTPDAPPPGDPDAPSGTDLDPDLDVADPAGDVCSMPGSLTECPGIQVCRFYDSASGRCESCSPCGNLNDSCSASNQCDILFMCYLGKCTNFCTLGTFECGPIEDCIDIGHATKGVCIPF